MIPLQTLVLVLVSVSLSALAQIALKAGMSSDTVREALAGKGNWLVTYYELLTQPYVFLGLVGYGVGALLWLLVLSRLEVSVAYPFVGLGFILTMALGALLLGEQVDLSRVLGTLLVVGGVVLVART